MFLKWMLSSVLSYYCYTLMTCDDNFELSPWTTLKVCVKEVVRYVWQQQQQQQQESSPYRPSYNQQIFMRLSFSNRVRHSQFQALVYTDGNGHTRTLYTWLYDRVWSRVFVSEWMNVVIVAACNLRCSRRRPRFIYLSSYKINHSRQNDRFTA